MTLMSFASVRFRLAAAACLVAPIVPLQTTAAGMVEPPAPDCNGEIVSRSAWLMGTTLRASVCAEARGLAIEVIEASFRKVRDAERRLSTWDDRSELGRLNAAPDGTCVPVSAWTARLLSEVRAWVEATDGAFDPAVGAALEIWDLRGVGRVPDREEVAAARRAAGPGAWEIDSETLCARRRPGVHLTAGAFGKGAGLRAALEALDRSGVRWAVLDFGGQLLIWSRDPARRFRIAVADPRARNLPAVQLGVGPGSLATTSESERFVETAAGRVGHVIDPRTARPLPAWGSVTVMTADPLAADVWSTALFVEGPDGALEKARSTAGIEVLVLEPTNDGHLARRSTNGWRALSTDTSQEPETQSHTDR